MKLNALAAALALGMAGPSFAATCTDSFNLGAMGPPGYTTIGNDFSSTGSFNDCYNFTLSSAADSLGFTMEWDASWKRDIDITSVSISGGSLGGTLTDSTDFWGINGFSFNNLLAGAYQLVVSGSVTGQNGGFLGGGAVGYVGALATSKAVAAPVPEPETYAMLALGLGMVGWMARRHRQA